MFLFKGRTVGTERTSVVDRMVSWFGGGNGNGNGNGKKENKETVVDGVDWEKVNARASLSEWNFGGAKCKWTRDDVIFMGANLNLSDEALAKILDRTPNAVNIKRYKFFGGKRKPLNMDKPEVRGLFTHESLTG